MEKIKAELLEHNLTLEQYQKILNDISDKKEGINDLDWSDICQMYSLDLNKDSLRKMNDGIFGGYFVKKYYEEKALSKASTPLSDSSFLGELESKKKELEILKIQVQDQRREYSKYLRLEARWEHLIEEMKLSIKDLPPLDFSSYNYDEESNIEASLLISDWHLGLECSNYWNTFNYRVATERINKLKQKVINYCKLHKVKTLHIEVLGDMINGAIHLGTRVESEEDVMSQAMRCAEIISVFVNDISKEIEQVNVYTVNGNHGRVTANKKDAIETENFERLIPWYMKTRLAESKNVKVCENEYDDTISHYMIGEKHIFSAHGHLDRVGDVIDNYTRMFKVIADEVHLAHFHSYYEKDEHGSTIVVNGTLSGVDTFAKSIRKTGVPTQILKIYGEDVCTYKITL